LIRTEKKPSLKFRKSKNRTKNFHILTATFKPIIWIKWLIMSKILSKS